MSFAAEYRTRCNEWSDIFAHLPYLFDSVPYGGTVLELGVRSGNSTAAFLHAVEVRGGHVWSVDINPPQVPDWWRESDLWTFTHGDDLHPAVAGAQPGDVDVLFIDTSHAYDQTFAELRLYGPRVRGGGVILCHDTELEVPDLVGPQPPFPVRVAVEEWVAERGVRYSFTEMPGCSGLGVVEVAGGA